jgi:hypothetical protein
MGNKEFKSLDALRPMAETLPVQRPPEQVRAVKVEPPKTDDDPLVQIAFAARFSTRKQMFQLARDKDLTLKTFILTALREKYPELDIRDADLADLRVKRR